MFITTALQLSRQSEREKIEIDRNMLYKGYFCQRIIRKTWKWRSLCKFSLFLRIGVCDGVNVSMFPSSYENTAFSQSFIFRVATEDKYSCSPMQVDINDITNVKNEKIDQEEGK